MDLEYPERAILTPLTNIPAPLAHLMQHQYLVDQIVCLSMGNRVEELAILLAPQLRKDHQMCLLEVDTKKPLQIIEALMKY
jgi:hypothetical protein